MHDMSISFTKLIAAGAWALATLFVALAWIAWAVGARSLAPMLALTGCPVVALAVVAHVRVYTMKVCGLLRARGIAEAPPADLYPLR